MIKKSGILALFVATCCILASCAGPFNLLQGSIYHNDNLIKQQVDTYTIKNRTGSILEETHIGEQTGSDTWVRLSVPQEGGTFYITYDVTTTAGDFKLVFVENGKSVEVICEGTAQGSRTFTLEHGDYSLKAVGAGGTADIAIQLQATEGITATMPGGPLDDDLPLELDPPEDSEVATPRPA